MISDSLNLIKNRVGIATGLGTIRKINNREGKISRYSRVASSTETVVEFFKIVKSAMGLFLQHTFILSLSFNILTSAPCMRSCILLSHKVRKCTPPNRRSLNFVEQKPNKLL